MSEPLLRLIREEGRAWALAVSVSIIIWGTL